MIKIRLVVSLRIYYVGQIGNKATYHAFVYYSLLLAIFILSIKNVLCILILFSSSPPTIWVLESVLMIKVQL